MVTIKDIAKKINLGVSTVSMALNNNSKINEETRKKVFEVAKNMGYVKNGLAADLQRGRSNLILVVVDDAARPFFARFIDVVQRKIAEFDFDLLISTTFQNHTTTAKRYISEHRAAGAIVFTMNICDDFVNTYANEDFPIFVLGRHVEGSPYVLSKNDTYKISMGYVNTKYLADNGFRKIAYVRTNLQTLGTVRRFEGYLNGLKDAGIEYDESLVYDIDKSDFDSGYEITKEMINKVKDKKIDAVFYSNDDVAIGGLHCFLDNGINVPADVSIIGQNDFPEARMTTPQLTTVASSDPNVEYLYAVDMLIAMINGDNTDKINNSYSERIKSAKEVVIERGTVLKK